MAEALVKLPKRRGRPRTNTQSVLSDNVDSTSDVDAQQIMGPSGGDNPVTVTLTQASPDGPIITDAGPNSRTDSNRSFDMDLGDLFEDQGTFAITLNPSQNVFNQRITTPTAQLPLTMPRVDDLNLGPPEGVNPPLTRGKSRVIKATTTKPPARGRPRTEDLGGGDLLGYNLRDRGAIRRHQPVLEPSIPRRQEQPVEYLEYRPRPRQVISPSLDDLRISEPDSRRSTALVKVLSANNFYFSGKPGEDVDDFLCRVNQARLLVGASDQDVLVALSFCLRGIAFTWFRTHADELPTWDITQEAFRDSFADPDYQRALREEIERRTQASSESVRSFISCMRGLFQRTNPPWPERERVLCTIRNLLPSLQRVISANQFLTMRAVEDEALRQERISLVAQNRRPPPRPEHSLCPGFAFSGPRSVSFASPRSSRQNDARVLLEEDDLREFNDSCLPEEDLELQALNREILRNRDRIKISKSTASVDQGTQCSPPSSPAYNRRNLTRNSLPVSSFGSHPERPIRSGEGVECWNCNTAGHVHRDCPEPRRRFCYRCRRPGVTMSTCSFCNPGNAI